MSALTVLLFPAEVLVGILAGLHVAGSGGLNPAFGRISPSAFVEIKQACDVTFLRIARPCMLTALAATSACCAVAATEGAELVAALSAVSVLSLAATLVAILRGDLPINRQMAAWDPARPPADWRDVLARWNRFFAVRTAASTLALLAMTWAALQGS